ncbi:MAG TPA: efflux RND transporter periplasmic adaptor subunit [Candidatus Eisenbacteria bacterium]|nr:efflux RND transporter periplasmic adaptor subunit [Candidatus Eisenbacteria bacterium]
MNAITGPVHRLTLGAALVTFAVLGCAKGGPGGGGFGGGMPPMPAETAVVGKESVVDRFEAIGTVQATDRITVVSEIDAAVTSLPFREGQPIAKGGLIARLDDDQLRAEVDRASAVRDQAKSTYERVKEVVGQGAGSAQDLDEAGGALKVAEANLALARTRLSKTRITAPFSGLVGSRQVSPGAYLRAGTPITDLAQVGTLKVTFSVPERYLGKLHRGSAVSVTTTAFPGYALTGKIDVIDPALDEATRSAQVIARVPNPGNRFRPGMSADVSAVLSERMNALTIPSEAVFAEGTQTFVYVVAPDSSVARTAVKLGTRLADVVEVTEGLKEGDRIVRAGHQKLFDKAKVIPIDSRAAAQAGGAGGAAPAAPGAPEAGKPAQGSGHGSSGGGH